MSFGTASTCYDIPLDVIVKCNSEIGGSVIAPYAVDLDNGDVRNTDYAWDSSRHPEFFYWGKTTIDGKQAFVATWMNSKGYDDSDHLIDRTNLWSTFQIVIKDTSSSLDPNDPSFGSADVIVNYGSMLDSGNGYGTNLMGPSYPCDVVSGRCVAVGLGSNYKDENGDWNPQLTSLTDEASLIQYNGLAADEVTDGANYPLNRGRYNSSVDGRYVFYFGNAIAPPIATISSEPVNVRATGLDGAISVRWETPTDLGGSAISSYLVQYRNVNDSNWTDASSSATAPYSITGLTNGERYEVRVSANNGVGDSEYSLSAFGVPGSELQVQSVQDGYSAEDGYWNPLSFVSELVGSGVQISNVLIDGESSFSGDFAAKFGKFNYGETSVGISSGIVMSPTNVKYFERANDLTQGDGILHSITNATYVSNWNVLNELLWNSESWVPDEMSSSGGEYGPICTNGSGPGSDCAYTSTFIDFDVEPTQDFLKFEYAIAGTEVGGEAYQYPDGFALFVGGQSQTDNCAILPDGAVPGATLSQRYLSVGNLRLAGLSRTVDQESPLKAVDVSQVMSCVVDISRFNTESENVHVTMGIANANDTVISPAVFLKANSIRFEAVAISRDAIPTGIVNSPYSAFTLTADGGTSPYVYSLALGSDLPPGMSLSSAGSLTGTPTSAGTFTFTIQVSDANENSSSQNFSMVVDPEPIIYDQGRINLDVELVDGEEVVLTPSNRTRISGFDPTAQLSLAMTISNGFFRYTSIDECSGISFPDGSLRETSDTSSQIIVMGTQGALNCLLGKIAITPYYGAKIRAGVISADSSFDPISKQLYGATVFEPGEEKTWSEARAAAQLNDSVVSGVNGYLASGVTDSEFFAMENFLLKTPNLPERLWIGLTDQADEGTWRWVDGIRDGLPLWMSSRWMPDEPAEGNTDKNYAFMYASGANFHKWESSPSENVLVGGYLAQWHLPEYGLENWDDFEVSLPANVLEDCNNPNTDQSVTMFSNGNPDDDGNDMTDSSPGAEDSNLLSSLCQNFDVNVFDGGYGSELAWGMNLQGASALIFPEMDSERDLVNTRVNGELLISESIWSGLRDWNDESHPVIFTGAYSHLSDINYLLDTDIPFTDDWSQSGSFNRSEDVNYEAPLTLAPANGTSALSTSNFGPTEWEMLSAVNAKGLYQDSSESITYAVASFENTNNRSGLVYYFGFDWYDDPSSEDASPWVEVLNLAAAGDLVVAASNPVEDDRFLQGTFVEVGIGGNGHFGSTGSAPDGYHPRDAGGGEGSGGGSSANRLGFVSDRDREGWGVGQDDGDFFVPGTPFEGFGVDVGGTSYFNNHEDTDIARLSEVTDVTPERQQSTWTSQVMSNGLQVTQVAAVPVNDQRLDVTVTLTNTSDIALEDVYYARQVDNDANVYACRENYGGWSSLNTVEAQASTSDGLSLVSSTMMDDCNDDEAPTDLSAPHSYLGMVSTDPNSVAALQYDEEYGFNGFGPQKAVDFVTGVLKNECVKRGNESCLSVNVTPGAQVFGDSGIGLGFDLGTISAGSTKTVTFSYILSPDQAQNIIDEHNNENEIVSPVLTASKNSFVAVVDSVFNLLAADWIDSQAGGAVSYYTVSPELPSGLSLNSTTGQISGTPTELLSTSSFTFTAHNLAGSSSVEFLLAVTDGPYLFNESGALMASWPSPSSNVVPEYEYSYSVDGGASWTESVIVENTTSPVMTVNLPATVGAEYIFRVRAVGDEVWFPSEPFYFGLTGCSSINPQLRVLMLSARSTEGTQGTDPATSDSNIRMAACSSPLVSVEIFDGQGYGAGAVKGSAEVWRTALEDIDVVVLPRLSNGDLEDSDLMSEAAFQELKYWVESGGRLILTGAASYVNDLNRLTYTDDPEYRPIESAPVSEVTGVRRVGGANTSLPATLPTFENDGLDVSQASPDFIASNYGETSDWLSPSLVTSFLKGKGWVVALSNEFTTADANWTKVLRQSIQSSVNPGIVVSEGGAYWYMNNGELHSQLDFQYLSAPGGIVRIGSETSSTSISCINTPSNPAIIYRKTEGTTVKCGKMNIDDGLVDRPVEVRLTRFFAASSPWVKTSVSIENVDRDNEYRNSVWFGGELGLGDKPLLEVDGQKQTSQNEYDYESPITVASAGDYVRTDYDSGDGHMVIRINSNFPSEVFGGLRLDENSAFTRDQMWTKSLFMLAPEESATFSWFETFAIYEPGCDRIASLNAWNKTEAFYSRALQENSNDGFKLNSRLTFPDLSDIGCQVYDARIDEIQMSDLGGSVRLNWDRVDSADKYEIRYRIESTNVWGELDEIAADENDLMTYLAQGLTAGQTYEFMIRPIQENRNLAGDTAQGAWRASGSLTISTPPTPSNSPSPSSSASPSPSQSQSPPPTNEVAQVPSQIVPQMIAQTGPGFPARLKKGKTVKFGMTAPSGLPLRVTSVGTCKTTAVTKTMTVKVLVGKKIKKKKVKVQTGWAIKGSKKGVCTVTFSNSGDATRSPLAAAGTITIF